MNLLERLKIWFIHTNKRIALKWLSMCDEWIEDRQEKAVDRYSKNTEMANFIPLKKFDNK